MNRFELNSRGKRARRLLGIATGRAILGPQVVSLEATHACNLRCSFCESHGSLQAAPITSRRTYQGGRRTMDIETVRRLVADLARLGTDLVELSGKGEPMEHRSLGGIVRIVKEAGLGCSLFTNGTLAQPGLALQLAEFGLDRLNLSLNAGSRGTFERVTGRDRWEDAIAFLEEVLEYRRGNGKRRPWVRISHVLCKQNVTDMERMVDLACSLGVDEVMFTVMSVLPETAPLQLDRGDVAAIRGRIAAWSLRLENARVVHELGRFGDELACRTGGTDARAQENPLQRRIPCYEGWMFCVIGPDGAVVPCCYCEELVLGNVFEGSFAKIWTGAPYRDIRRRMLAIPRTRWPICAECFTSCNRAAVNQQIYNRLHPFRKVMETPSLPARSGA